MFNLSINLKQNVTSMNPDLSSTFRRAMIGSTELIRRRATLNAPYMSGTLRRSITTAVSMDGREGVVGASVPYARRREFENNKNPNRKYYMKRARDSSDNEIEAIFKKEIEEHFRSK